MWVDIIPRPYHLVAKGIIYLEGLPIAPVFPSREWVVVTALNPITVESLNGVVPLLTAVKTISFQPNAVGLVQIINLSGVLSTDLIMVNATVNPAGLAIDSTITETDEFTITFDDNPGAGMFIDAIIFRPSFL